MIRQCQPQDVQDIYVIVNDAAVVYRGVIPDDCYHEPYMPLYELEKEMKQMVFFGWQDGGQLVGVMGFQPLGEVALIRHAYVLNGWQRQGIGSRLLNHLIKLTKTGRLLVGTWAEAHWAVRFYKKHGFQLLPNKDELLRAYWQIPDRQIETSVVLGRDLSQWA